MTRSERVPDAEIPAPGRLRVAAHLADWFEEFRLYHREPKGPLGVPQIVKINDDLLDATRYAMMSIRFARALPS